MNIYINKCQIYKYIYDIYILACFRKGASFCKQFTGTFCSFALERSRYDFPTIFLLKRFFLADLFRKTLE